MADRTGLTGGLAAAMARHSFTPVHDRDQHPATVVTRDNQV
ncbi:hypothetical protein [Calidifontibacter indicus]